MALSCSTKGEVGLPPSHPDSCIRRTELQQLLHYLQNQLHGSHDTYIVATSRDTTSTMGKFSAIDISQIKVSYSDTYTNNLVKLCGRGLGNKGLI
jgi:hypothetical protein